MNTRPIVFFLMLQLVPYWGLASAQTVACQAVALTTAASVEPADAEAHDHADAAGDIAHDHDDGSEPDRRDAARMMQERHGADQGVAHDHHHGGSGPSEPDPSRSHCKAVVGILQMRGFDVEQLPRAALCSAACKGAAMLPSPPISPPPQMTG